MNESLADLLRQMYSDAINYVKMWIEEGKIVGAQKASVLISMAAVAVICLVMGVFTAFLFAMALVAVFKLFLPEWLAFLSVGGILLLLSMLIVLLRKWLIVNPVCRLITKQLFEDESK